jgi:ABC-2 type transport system permease protein
MSGLCAIYRRELVGLFLGPLAWTLLCIALALQGVMFLFYMVGAQGDVDIALRFLLGDSFVFWILCALVPPLLTMRMLSEESRSGLLEYLLTAPVTDLAVVCGKFGAAVSFMALLWASVFGYALVLQASGVGIDWGIVFSSWIGATLCSALFCGIGLLMSSLTTLPVLSAFAAVIANLVLMLLPLVARLVDWPVLSGIVKWLDISSNLTSGFLYGVIDSAYLVFFLIWTAFLVFLTTRAVEARRWS